MEDFFDGVEPVDWRLCQPIESLFESPVGVGLGVWAVFGWETDDGFIRRELAVAEGVFNVTLSEGAMLGYC